MTAEDPLEALREVARWTATMEPLSSGGYGLPMGACLNAEKRIKAAIAAWEKERAERAGDAEGFAQKVDELAALRAEVLAVAEILEELAGKSTGMGPQTTYEEFLGEQAARLRKKACE